MIETYASLIAQVRAKKPLVHHITNYVTVKDCANITLGIGGSPIMADAIGEAADIASIASAFVLNIGTLNERTIPSMLAAGRAANAAGVPVVFDPVGAGASKLRNDTVAEILVRVRASVIRGNISEIRYIAGLQAGTKGVDAAESDAVGTRDAGDIARSVAREYGAVVAITGAVDVVSDGSRTCLIHNGHPMLSGLTGTGCMCTSLMGAYCGAAPERCYEGAVAALLTMGIAGELAHERAGQLGNGSFHTALMDAVSRMDAEVMQERGRIDEA